MSFSVKPPVHEDDCECIHICEKLGDAYNKCYKDTCVLTSIRCSSSERKQIIQNHKARKENRLIMLIATATLLATIAGILIPLLLQ